MGDDHIDLEPHQLVGECGERLKPALGESALDQNVLVFDVTKRPKPFAEDFFFGPRRGRRASREVAYPPNLCRLFRPCPMGENQGSGAYQEQTAGEHWIASCPRSSSDRDDPPEHSRG